MLFVASALPSHFFAMAPFAWAAHAAGHDVRVATQPQLCPAVAACGLATVGVGRPMDFAGDYRRGRAADPKDLFVRIAADMADDLVAMARHWRPDVVVWEPTSFAGPVAAAAAGAPCWRFLWGPDIVGRGGSGRERMPDGVRELFTRHGCSADQVPAWLTIDPCPPSVQVPTSAPWRHVRYVPHSTAARVPRAVLAPPRRPRVVVTLGMSVSGLVGEQAFPASRVARALAGDGGEVVVALGARQAAAFGEVPPGVRLVADCPVTTLLAGASAVVHHGGAGTMMSAVLAGVPQLVLSSMPDLGFYGDRLAATGAGLRLGADDADDTAVRDAVNRLRADATPALRLRAEALRQPTPARLLAELTAVPTM
ncbi:nucleotide disphospho-sugar-binding domain-containing protein [Actinoplanes nipponensis]|nr:nucleotide disphospho-sugar-binding domain-containing protein [Actinoplanes nipponensis]